MLLGLVVATLAWGCSVTARTPAAIAAIGFGVLWLLRFEWHPSRPVRLWAGAPVAALAYARRLDYSLLGLLPVAYAGSLLWAGEFAFTLKHLRITLTALGVSGVLYIYRDALAPYRRWGWYLLLGFAGITALGCVVYVLANQGAITPTLGMGSAVPTPRAHVRTATLFAFAALAGAHLLVSGRRRTSTRLLVALATATCILAIHAIAVRTGIALLYLGLALYALRFAIGRLRSPWAVALLCVGIAGLGSAATQLPNVKRKLEYMRYDLEHRDDPDALRFSDASRIISLEAALAIIAEAPLRGAHTEGLREEMRTAYAKTGYPEATLLPTNQYLFSWGLAGVPGLLGVLAFFVGPMLEPGWLRRPLLFEYLALTGALCLVETPFANDVGVALSVLVVCFAKAGPVPPTGPRATNPARDA